MDVQDIVSTLAASIRLSTPLVLAVLAGLYSAPSGALDIGLAGIMLAGAFAAGAWRHFPDQLVGLAAALVVSG